MITGINLAFGVAIFAALASLTSAQQEGNQAGKRPESLSGSPEKICPILVGTKVPDVLLADIKGNPIKLYSLLQKKPTVLVFYRGGWCPYCNLQLEQLHTIESEVLDQGYQIAAISADRPGKLTGSIDRHALRYTLLSDSTMSAAKAFGIAFRVGNATVEKYKKNGIDLEAASGLNHHMLPVPAVFIVQKGGNVLFEYVNPNYKVRLNAQVVLALIKADSLQTKDKRE
jgi:peroxiredoxin